MATRFTYHPVFDFRHNGETEIIEDEDLDDFEDMLDDDLPFSFYSMQPDPLDAATQTDVKKKSHQNEEGHLRYGSYQQNTEMKNEKSVGRYSLSKRKSEKKERSPRTVLKLMERHRHNERVRHHTLNKRLKAICQHVPGSGEDGRETKVVMMQRIISYIAYLENTIAEVSVGLGMEPDPKFSPLTTTLRKQIEECASMAVVPDIEDPVLSNMNPRMNAYEMNVSTCSRRYKLSSPTIDSTTDRMVPDVHDPYPTSVESSQDSMAPSSTFFPYMANDTLAPWLIDGPMITTSGDDFGFFDPIVEEVSCHNFSTEPSSSYYNDMNIPNEISTQSTCTSSLHDSMSFFTSPSKLSTAFSNEDSPDFLGDSLNDTFGLHDLLNNDPNFINPVTVLPAGHDVSFPQKESSDEFSLEEVELDLDLDDSIDNISEASLKQPRNKRKQYKPAKHQPVNLTNTDSSSPFSTDEIIGSEVLSNISQFVSNTSNIEDKSETQIITHHVPFTWTFHSMNDNVTKSNTVHNIKIEAEKYSEPKFIPVPIVQKQPCKEVKPQKIDHRKTSWMNGFMMYSRLNRRQFINANPGVHTSHISKMMGQSWRTMSNEVQQPYKEKAKQYLKDMQKVQEYTSEENVNMSVHDECKENNIKIEPEDCCQVVPINITTSLPHQVSTSSHPIYNSQRWTYL